MERHGNGSFDKDLFYAIGGAAMVFAGAAFMLAHPDIRRILKDAIRASFPQIDSEEALEAGITAVLPNMQKYLETGITAVLPDIERYMKMRSM